MSYQQQPQQYQQQAAPQPGQMQPMGLWALDYYVIKQKVLSIGNKYFIENEQGQRVGFCHQKILKLKEDIRIHTDDNMTQELLNIRQEQIVDAWGTFMIVDSPTNQVVGFFRRKYMKSMFKDEWEILDAYRNQIGRITEDSGGMAILRRIFGFIPKKYHIELQGQHIITLTQKFKIIGDTWWLDCRSDPGKRLDRRMVVAGAILMDAVEQAQRR